MIAAHGGKCHRLYECLLINFSIVILVLIIAGVSVELPPHFLI